MHRLIVLLVFGVLVGSCAAYTATSGRVAIRDDRAPVEAGFSNRDRQLMTEYFRGRGRSARDATVRLQVHAPLPAGTATRPLPHELEMKLTALPSLYSRVLVGRDAVLMERDSRMVLDIAHGVIPE